MGRAHTHTHMQREERGGRVGRERGRDTNSDIKTHSQTHASMRTHREWEVATRGVTLT